jgi:hypothetical protein
VHDAGILRSGECVLLEAHLPGRHSQRIGVLVLDSTRNTLRVKIRPPPPSTNDEAEILRDLATDLETMALEMGAVQLLDHLQDTASNAVRLGVRKIVTFSDLEATLETLL